MDAQTRYQAIQSLTPHTRQGYASAIKAWMSFCEAVRKPALPGDGRTLAWFCTLFRNAGTLKVYLAGIRKMHDLAGHPMPSHPLVPRSGAGAMGPIAAAPWSSASILPISYVYIRAMGSEGLKKGCLMRTN